MTLNLKAAERQLMGRTYDRDSVDQLLAHRLTMRPHPVWDYGDGEIDWEADPLQDSNWRHQLQMLRFTRPLIGAAYAGESEALDELVRIVRSWVNTYCGSSVAKRSPQWANMVDGIRAIHLCIAAPPIVQAHPELEEFLAQAIREHAEWMSNEKNLGHSNHALHQHESLFVCGAVLGETRFMELATKRIDSLVRSQYDEQGINAEGAIAYHLLNYSVWRRLFKRMELEGTPIPPSGAILESAALALAHSTRPDGRFPSIGDTDGGSPSRVGTPETSYVTSDGAKGTPPEETLAVYDAGYVFGRSGWGETERSLAEETFFSISFGSSRRVHGHHDGTSITYSAAGKNWLVDPGKYQYGTSPERARLLQRAAHNVVSLKHREPARNATAKLVRHTENPRFWDFTFTDDSYAPTKLTRRIVYSVEGEYMVVIDGVDSTEDVSAEIRWQLGPEVSVSQLKSQQVDLAAGSSFLTLAFTGTKTDIRAIQPDGNSPEGWVATGWKQKKPAGSVIGEKQGKKFRFVTVIAASEKRAPIVKTLRSTTPGALTVNVSTNRTSETITIGAREVVFSAGEGMDGDSGHASSLLTSPSLTTDVSVREQVFGSISAAFEEAREADLVSRRRIAAELSALSSRLSLAQGDDLGLGAAALDISADTSSAVIPARYRLRSPLINWDGRRGWTPTRYALPVHTHFADSAPDAEHFKAPAIHTFVHGSAVIPTGVDPAPGSTLTVLFHGALDRSKTQLPILQRWRHQTELQFGPTMVFGDPTLDISRQLRLSWYLGNEHIDAHHEMARVVRHVSSLLGTSRTLLIGSSGGGFAALQVGTLLGDDTKVIAMSSQTDLRKYPARFHRAAFQYAFGLASSTEVPASLLPRISVAERIRTVGNFPEVLLVSNVGDSLHCNDHEGPLRDFYRQERQADRLNIRATDLGPGHRSVENDEYTEIIAPFYT